MAEKEHSTYPGFSDKVTHPYVMEPELVKPDWQPDYNQAFTPWNGQLNSSVAPENATPDFAGFRATNARAGEGSGGSGNPNAGK